MSAAKSHPSSSCLEIRGRVSRSRLTAAGPMVQAARDGDCDKAARLCTSFAVYCSNAMVLWTSDSQQVKVLSLLLRKQGISHFGNRPFSGALRCWVQCRSIIRCGVMKVLTVAPRMMSSLFAGRAAPAGASDVRAAPDRRLAGKQAISTMLACLICTIALHIMPFSCKGWQSICVCVWHPHLVFQSKDL